MKIVISLLLLLGTLGFVESYSHGEAVPIRKPLDRFPMSVEEWQGRETTILSEAILEVLKPTDYLVRRYEDPEGRDVSLYIAYWETQKRGAQFHSPKHCMPGGGWEPLEADVVPLEVGGERIPVNRYVLQKDASRLLVTYWYQAQGDVLATEFDAKIALVKNSILHNRSDGAIIRVMAPVDGNLEATWSRLVNYIEAIYPRLDAFLPA